MLRINPKTGKLEELSQKQREALLAYNRDKQRQRPAPIIAPTPKPIMPRIDEEPGSPKKAPRTPNNTPA